MARTKKSNALTTIVVLLVILVALLCVKLFVFDKNVITDNIIDKNNETTKTNEKEKPNENVNNTQKNNTENNILENNEENTMKEPKTIVSKGDTVAVDYVGKLTDGTVFDTSIESVAKENGVYQTGRDYVSGLEFEVGAGKMIAGFDKAVVGMKVGETKNITLEPKDAYGERDEKKVQLVPFEKLPAKPNGESYVKGDKLQSAYGPVEVIEITKSGAKLDFNLPYAGKTLIFDITIKSIK